MSTVTETIFTWLEQFFINYCWYW